MKAALGLAASALGLAAAACASAPQEQPGPAAAASSPRAASHPAAVAEPVFEVVPPRSGDSRGAEPGGYLDPAAAPSTPLGALRAARLPVWSSAFDSAFPPEVCASAWHLDAIAEPAVGVDMSAYGDVAALAAIAVMRYEHLVGAASASSSPLGQLCIAVASVGEARASALSALAAQIAPVSGDGDGDDGTGAPAAGETGAFPRLVRVVAVSPTTALATACVEAPDVPTPAFRAGATMRAYELAVTRGIEDEHADVSYRVARIAAASAADCSALPSWTARWEAQVALWIDEGRIWSPTGAEISADRLCDSPPIPGIDECPLDWPSPLPPDR